MRMPGADEGLGGTGGVFAAGGVVAGVAAGVASSPAEVSATTQLSTRARIMAGKPLRMTTAGNRRLVPHDRRCVARPRQDRRIGRLSAAEADSRRACRFPRGF